MMARGQASLLAVAITAVAVFATTVSGASYTVGEPGGSWDLRTNFAAWASSIDFYPGDQVVFNYSASAHDVVEVSQDGYRSCSAASPVSTSRTGSDTVQLGSTGRRYFICSVPGHCEAGMKLQISVLDVRCNKRSPSSAPPPPPEATNGAPGVNGAPSGIIICPGDSPRTIMAPGVISYGSAPGSSANLSFVLVTMASLLLGLVV